MRFANPQYLVPVVVAGLSVAAFLLWSHAARLRVVARFAQQHLLDSLGARTYAGRRILRNVLRAGAIVFCLFAFTRPQWGFEWREVRRRGLDVLVAVDTSKSMLAGDIKPSRFQRAKLAIKDFVRHLEGDRIGLIGFSGSAFLQCPLTVDYSGFLFTLESLEVGIIPRPGTSIARAIREALRTFEGTEKKQRVMIIITDGENHEGDALLAAREAKKEGVVIHTVGVGTRDGELIHLRSNEGRGVFLKDNRGNVVKTRLEEKTLREIALITGGSYVRSRPREFGLEALYRQKISVMEKRDIEGAMARHYHDRFQIPLGIALLLLFAEMLTGKRKPFSTRGVKNGLPLIFLLGGFTLAHAASDATIVSRGNSLYNKARYDQALEVYRQGIEQSPESEVLHFNAGAAAYKNGEYQAAGASFERVLLSDDERLEADARYNLGGARYMAGRALKEEDISQAVASLEEALSYYKGALEFDHRDEDARFNYEFVKRELDELKEQRRRQQCPHPQQQGQQEDKEDTAVEPRQQSGREEQKQEPSPGEDEQQGARQDEQQQGEQPEDNRQGVEEDERAAQGEQQSQPQEMSPEQARMLLNGAGRERSLQELLHERRRGEAAEVLKDW
ncbi:MAG: VWA domain-containing protein [Candidatus Omnitrophica bacterium]|nr:VWA domain-containing protein [Candidatus Omnitrophota bacterium]